MTPGGLRFVQIFPELSYLGMLANGLLLSIKSCFMPRAWPSSWARVDEVTSKPYQDINETLYRGFPYQSASNQKVKNKVMQNKQSSPSAQVLPLSAAPVVAPLTKRGYRFDVKKAQWWIFFLLRECLDRESWYSHLFVLKFHLLAWLVLSKIGSGKTYKGVF